MTKIENEKMKQNASFACGEMKGFVAVSASSVVDHSYRRERAAVVCPKPRRVGLINPALMDPVSPRRLHFSYQQEVDVKSGAELLDLIVSKGGYGSSDQSCVQVASSPPFFCGSPPSRVSNPLIQDARFGDERVTPVSPRAIPIPSGLSASPTSSARKSGGCIRANFGNNPAVRVEGFDCLDRDGRNCSIPALA